MGRPHRHPERAIVAKLKTENEMDAAIWEHVAIPGVHPPEDAIILEETKLRLLSGEISIEDALADPAQVMCILIDKED